MGVVALLAQLFAALPGEFQAISDIAKRVRSGLGTADQAALDAAEQTAFDASQAAVAKADAALTDAPPAPNLPGEG